MPITRLSCQGASGIFDCIDGINSTGSASGKQMERQMANVTDYHASHRSAHGNPLDLLKVFLRRFKDRRDMNYLLSLPDYQLRDIGLQRGDIQREALKPLWQDVEVNRR
jgi:uncharacterized protein YjiS (DUF1127 family)